MQKGRIVILTREQADNAPLLAQLKRLNVETLNYPCIETEIVPYRGTPINGMALEDFEAIVFSSRRGVRGMQPVAERLRLSQCVIAAVGETTAMEIEEVTGRHADSIARPQTGRGMALTLMKTLSPGSNVLHVRGSKTTGIFKNMMQEAGYAVFDLIVYENREPVLEPVALDKRPVVVFASPSAVKRFYEANPFLRETATNVAIGKTTADYLKNLNISDVFVAGEPTTDGLLECISGILLKA